MEESQISVLPPDLAQEAQNLRREWEARNRHMMQERFLNHVSQSNTALSSILRNSGRGKFQLILPLILDYAQILALTRIKR